MKNEQPEQERPLASAMAQGVGQGKGKLKISRWQFPDRMELIVEDESHWVASFNWDEGKGDNPYTPTEKEARANAQLFLASREMQAAIRGFLNWWGNSLPCADGDEMPKEIFDGLLNALLLSEGKEPVKSDETPSH